jgi:hypothetical protein
MEKRKKLRSLAVVEPGGVSLCAWFMEEEEHPKERSTYSLRGVRDKEEEEEEDIKKKEGSESSDAHFCRH